MAMPLSLRACGAAVSLLLCMACGGGSGPAPAPFTVPPGGYLDPAAYSMSPGASLPSATEGAAITHHQLTLGGATLAYTATAGHLTASDPVSGQPLASFFYTAYTLDGQAPATRPLTFLYNGGPGSASLLLHLGSFAPKRLVTGDPATTGAQPFPLVDNQECLLDQTDLVFLDPPGTGLSEAIAPNTNQTFWGVDVDAAVIRAFLQRYLSVNGRQGSPTYLFGESYGTTRTAVLANVLETAGMPLTGIVLQSSILDYNVNLWEVDSILNNAAILPTYAATGAWYGLDEPVPGDLGTFEQAMETFAADTYQPAVNTFLSAYLYPTAKPVFPPSCQALIPQLVGDTGIQASVWATPALGYDVDSFDLYPYMFQRELVPGSLTGIYDARVLAELGSPLAAGGDPSDTLIAQPFATAMASYLQSFLGYYTTSSYTSLSDAIDTWDFSHDGEALPDVIPDLAAALTQNERLQVFSANGAYDLITPFFQTEQDLARLGTLGFQPAVGFHVYGGGHMIYLDDAARVAYRGDLTAFYQGTAPTGQISTAAIRSLARAQAGAPPRSGAARTRPVLHPGLEPVRSGRPLPVRRTPPSAGAELQAQVERKLAASRSRR